jgi:hypothetical protein
MDWNRSFAPHADLTDGALELDPNVCRIVGGFIALGAAVTSRHAREVSVLICHKEMRSSCRALQMRAFLVGCRRRRGVDSACADADGTLGDVRRRAR